MSLFFVIDLENDCVSVDDDSDGERFTTRADAEARAKQLASGCPGTMYAIAEAVQAASCEVAAPKMVDV